MDKLIVVHFMITVPMTIRGEFAMFGDFCRLMFSPVKKHRNNISKLKI